MSRLVQGDMTKDSNEGATGDPCPVAMRGIVPSLHTPFTADDAVDEASLRRLVDRTIAAGCAGMLVGAVAGEVGSLTPDEKRLVAEVVLDQAAGAIPVIVGVSAATQAERLATAKAAREMGADWILCQAPEGATGAALVDVYAELAEAGPPNLMVQDLSWDGPGVALDDILRLFAEVPAFRSLKVETVPAGPKYTAVLAATGGRLHVCGGWAIMQMIEALGRGVHALMPSGLDPIYVRIHRLFMAGREAEARDLFERILPVLAFTQQHIDVSIGFLKRLRVEEGVLATARSRAAGPLDAAQLREVDRLVARVLALQAEVAASSPV